MSQILPTLDNYPDFVRLLNNAGYDVWLNFIYPAGSSATPMISVSHPASEFEDDATGTPAMADVPLDFRKWLDNIAKNLGLQVGFELKSEDLQALGFESGADGLWKKKSPHLMGDALLLDPQGVYGGRLLSAIDHDGDELMNGELYGPVSSLKDFERLLRDRGWLGISSEPL